MDDVEIGIDSVNVLLQKRGLKTLESREEYQRIFGFPIIDYYRRLGFDFDREPYEDIAVEWVNEYVARECTAKTIDGVKEMLDFFKSRNIKQIIISACEQTMLDRNLKMLGVSEYFDTVCGINNIYASSKEAIGVAWREQNPNEKLLFIGDTDHDCDVARAMGADCILVAQGHQSFETLSAYSDYAKVVRNMSDIIDAIS
jgi:phosphoglycolate phosphatase